jgi:hypothetical protein
MIGLLGSSPPIDGGLRYMTHGALNAVTEYHDWEFGYPEVTRPGRKCTLNVVFGRAKAAAGKTFAYLA